MSYDTPISDTYAFDYASKDKYDYNYHYDTSTTRDDFLNADKAAVIFPAKKSSLTKEEILKAVNVTIVDVESPKSVGEATIQTDIYVDVNGNESNIYSSDNSPINKNGPVARVTRKIDHEGSYTLELPEEVTLKNGQYFSVVISISSPNNKYRVALATEKPSSNNDLTFYQNEEGKWENCGTPTFRQVARIKAFTKTKDRLTPMDKDLRYTSIKVDPSFKPRYNAIPKDINFEVSSENEILNKDIDYIMEAPEVTINPELIEVTSDDDIVALASIKLIGIDKWKGEKIVHFPILVGFHDLSKFGEILDDNTLKITVDGSHFKYSDISLDENWAFVFEEDELKIGENTGNYISYVGKDEICFRRNMFPVIVIKTTEVKPKVDITNAIFSLENDTFVYNGEKQQPSVNVKHEGKSLLLDRDFKVEYKNNIDVGNGEAKVIGIGKYQGDKILQFNIGHADINSCITSYDEESVYTGKEITLDITLELANYNLVLDKDFRIIYSDNINAGKGKIKIIGINNFKGEVLKEFVISKAKNEIIKFELVNNEPNAIVKFGEAYYKYYSDKECLKEVDKPIEPGLYYVKAFVNGNSNYEDVSSDPLEFNIKREEKPIEPEPPYEVPDKDNKDETNVIIIASVVTPLAVITLTIVLIFFFKRKRK